MRLRRASTLCTSSSFLFRAGPDTPSRTMNRWWHCVHKSPITAPRWQRRQKAVPHFTQCIVNDRLPPRQKETSITTSAKAATAPVKRLSAAARSGASRVGSGARATFFVPTPEGVPANLAQTCS